MALEDIEVFIEVVDAKSFSRAAKRLGMPTSTVSAKMARLEETLGITLIQRTTRQMSVTPEGKTYYEYCSRALAELTEAKRALAQATQEPEGKLKLSAPADIAQVVLAPIIESYLARYPRVSVELIVTNRKVDLIGEGIDLAVRIGNLTSSSLIARKFFDARVGLWASESYLKRHGVPNTIADLAQHEMIEMTLARGEVKLQDKNGTAADLNFSGRLATDDMQNCRTLIETGAGIGPLADFIGESTSGLSQLVRVMPDLASAPTSAYFIYPTQRFVPPKVRAFIDRALERN